MALVVRAFPLVAGQEDALHEFARELDARRAETGRFYRKYGVVRESWHLQKGPQGGQVIAVTEIMADVAQASEAYARANAEFDAWFKSRVRALSGVDPNVRPLGPECCRVFEWKD
jgi:hypothetical protein